MKQNKQHSSKSTNHNLQTWPFEAAEKSLCFLGGPLECVMEAKNVNVSCNFDLRLYVIAKQGNGRDEIACRWQNNSLGQTNMSPGCKVFNRKTLSGETLYLLWKTFAIIQYVKIVLPVTCCFLMYCWLAHNQLSWNVLVLSSNPIGQLCLNGLGYSSRTVIQCTTTTPIRPRGGHTIKQITCNITDSILETLQHKCLNPLTAVTAKTSRTRLHCFKILQLPQSLKNGLNCQLWALSRMSFKLGYLLNAKKSALFAKYLFLNLNKNKNYNFYRHGKMTKSPFCLQFFYRNHSC